MTLAELAQVLVNAVLQSGILALVALGFALVWGMMNIVNLAHGAFIVLGAYVTWTLHEALGLDPFLTIPVAMLLLYAVGWLLQRALVNQIIRAPLLATFLLTFGLEILIVNLINFFFRGDVRAVTTSYSGSGLSLGDVRVPYIRIAALGIAAALVALLAWFLRATRTGRAIRATSMDIDAARLTGVDVAAVYAATYGLGAAMAGAAGALLSMMVPFDPNLGGTYTLRAFVICVLGGLGNVANVVVGATIFAVADAFVGAEYPSLARAITFGLLVLILVLRPQLKAERTA